jgi:hypothetical protein
VAALASPQNKKTGMLILSLDAADGKARDYGRIEAVLIGFDGVLKTTINHATGMIKIEFDPQKLTLEKIRRALSKAQG